MFISSPNILLVFIFELFCLWWSIVYYCLSAMPGGIMFGKPRCESWCSIRSKPNSYEDINSDHCNSWFFFVFHCFSLKLLTTCKYLFLHVWMELSCLVEWFEILYKPERVLGLQVHDRDFKNFMVCINLFRHYNFAVHTCLTKILRF